MKIGLNSRDDQTDKKTSQAKDKASPAEQGSEAEKFSKKARKEKKKKDCQGQCKKLNLATTEANTAIAIATDGKGQKKKKKAQDISEITYYSCNKKGHYASDCTGLKNYLQS